MKYRVVNPFGYPQEFATSAGMARISANGELEDVQMSADYVELVRAVGSLIIRPMDEPKTEKTEKPKVEEPEVEESKTEVEESKTEAPKTATPKTAKSKK